MMLDQLSPFASRRAWLVMPNAAAMREIVSPATIV